MAFGMDMPKRNLSESCLYSYGDAGSMGFTQLDQSNLLDLYQGQGIEPL